MSETFVQLQDESALQASLNTGGTSFSTIPAGIPAARAPKATDFAPQFTLWAFGADNEVWIQSAKGQSSTWLPIANGTGIGISSINGIFPNSTGNFSLNGTTNQILVTPASNGDTLSIPTTFIAPGSIASTTTLTGGTGVTATTGNITASAAASGLVLNPTVVTAGASPQTANGRVVAVTFSGVSIAAAATQTFVITNSAVTGAGTQIHYSMVGATTGSALTIESVTNSAGSSSIVVTNGTGASTSTANLTFQGIVLN